MRHPDKLGSTWDTERERGREREREREKERETTEGQRKGIRSWRGGNQEDKRGNGKYQGAVGTVWTACEVMSNRDLLLTSVLYISDLKAEMWRFTKDERYISLTHSPPVVNPHIR